MEIAPGAHHFRHWLTIERQRARADHCRALVDGAVPAYVPIVRGGGTMHVRMLCLGRHWNAQTYRYESTRSDSDGLPAPPVGDTARFLFGGLTRRDPVESILLESGDAFVFGGPARLRYHGVSRIASGTAPVELDLSGRFNLTVRRSDETCHALS